MKMYCKKQLQPMMPWEPDMPMVLVSVSEADRSGGSPKHGDMIAVNPKKRYRYVASRQRVFRRKL